MEGDHYDLRAARKRATNYLDRDIGKRDNRGNGKRCITN